MSKNKPRDWKDSLGVGFVSVAKRLGCWEESAGFVHTPHGTVGILRSFDLDDGTSSNCSLEFAHNGTRYVRCFDHKAFTDRGMVTKARQFAAAVVAGEVSQ